MSVTSAKTGSTSLSLALENNFMEPIASTLVGAGGANAVIFNDIPQTYKHLQVRLTCALTAAVYDADIVMQFNGDYANSYSKHRIYGSGSSVGVDSGTPNFMQIARSGGAASVFGAAIIDILDYTNTNKTKVVRSFFGQDSNGSGYMMISSGLWNNTSPVTSIRINEPNFTGSFAQHTRISLYGMKG
jgi:hypothetical protein